MSDSHELGQNLSHATAEQKQRLAILYEELNRTQIQLLRLARNTPQIYSNQVPGMIAELNQQRLQLVRKIDELTADIQSVLSPKH